MDNNTPRSYATYAPLKNQEDETPFPYPSDPNQAFANQAFPTHPQPQTYPPQSYPPQGYVPQPGYVPSPYPPQPMYTGQEQPYVQPAVMQPVQPQVVFVNPEDPYLDSTPFVPTSESFTTQVGRVPKDMWAALSRPNMLNFNELKMRASWAMVWFILALKVVILLCLDLMAASIIAKEAKDAGVPYYESLQFTAWYTIISIPIGFFLVNGFIAMLARCVAGHRPELITHPTFLQFCYITLLVSFPIDIINIFIGLIPAVGGLLVIVVSIYELILWVCGLKGVYHMTTGQAIGVIVLFCLCVLALFIVLALTVGIALVEIIAGAN